MSRPQRMTVALCLLIALLAACAPEGLDITPTVTPSSTPEPTNTPLPTPVPMVTIVVVTATPAADQAAANGTEGATPVPEATDELVDDEVPPEGIDAVIASIPERVDAGGIQWMRTADPPIFRDVEGGRTGRVAFSERGGGAMELTFGLFETDEAARAYYDQVRGSLRTLERAQTRDNFPQPNAFGGGTYGSDAVFVFDNVFVRLSVPRFSSTAGDPLVPLARTVFRTLLPGAGITPPAS